MTENNTENRDRISVSLPLDERYVQVLRLLISGVGARMNYTYDDLEDIKLALNEAYMLALRQVDEGRTNIELLLSEDDLTVYFEGHGFSEPAEDDEVQTWSLFLLEGLMDKVDFIDTQTASKEEQFDWSNPNSNGKCLKLHKRLRKS